VIDTERVSKIMAVIEAQPYREREGKRVLVVKREREKERE
jgi:hypothetical protein